MNNNVLADGFKYIRQKALSSARLGLITFLVAVSLTGCVSDTAYAPVANAQTKGKSGYYTVRSGDTLYSIAWAYGLDYRALADANHLAPPYRIHPGQKINMTNVAQGEYQPPKIITRKKVTKTVSAVLNPTKKKYQEKPQFTEQFPQRIQRWRWPARGRVVLGFERTLAGNKGIDIAGNLGEPVRAAASGEVVYSGAGVRGYGNLIIIKHNSSYLSAYAYNKKLLVGVGQQVRAGQEIALMGRNDAGQVRLHFEIRHNGVPVNPMRYLRN